MKKELFFIIALGLILSISMPLFNPGKGEQDFLGYWAAARLFVTGGNPYNTNEMVALQSATSPERFTDENGLVNAWNPPWLILLLLPIALLPYPLAVPVWVFCNTLLIGFALLLAWKICMGEQQSRGILVLFLAGFLFGETLAYLAIGQITALVLVGIVLVVWWVGRKQDFLAGAALLAATSKPHISYLLILLFLIWVIQNRRWKVIAGLTAIALASMVIFWIVTPTWISDYIRLIENLPYPMLYTSTLGSYVAARTGIWIFNYSAVFLIFLIKPLLHIVKQEGWLTGANLALLISIPLSPFGFNFDQVIILPALAQMISWSARGLLSRNVTLLMAAGLVVINLVVIRMVMVPGLEHYWFFWIPLAVLGIYLAVWKKSTASVMRPE